MCTQTLYCHSFRNKKAGWSKKEYIPHKRVCFFPLFPFLFLQSADTSNKSNIDIYICSVRVNVSSCIMKMEHACIKWRWTRKTTTLASTITINMYIWNALETHFVQNFWAEIEIWLACLALMVVKVKGSWKIWMHKITNAAVKEYNNVLGSYNNNNKKRTQKDFLSMQTGFTFYISFHSILNNQATHLISNPL